MPSPPPPPPVCPFSSRRAAALEEVSLLFPNLCRTIFTHRRTSRPLPSLHDPRPPGARVRNFGPTFLIAVNGAITYHHLSSAGQARARARRGREPEEAEKGRLFYRDHL